MNYEIMTLTYNERCAVQKALQTFEELLDKETCKARIYQDDAKVARYRSTAVGLRTILEKCSRSEQ